jgi:hypothetical protein
VDLIFRELVSRTTFGHDETFASGDDDDSYAEIGNLDEMRAERFESPRIGVLGVTVTE